MAKIKVGIVDYLNTKPLLEGIMHSDLLGDIELVPDYPANIDRMLVDNEIDLGLVPVAVIPRLKEYHIISDYCIGTRGKVASVCILSNQPLDQVKKILIDYQSRTSAMLVKILIKKFWKLGVELVDTQSDYRHLIEGDTAGLVIGDRCLEYRHKVKYVYDLGEAWLEFTGLPFVFATWISNKALPGDFIRRFNEANAAGIRNIEKVIFENNFSYYDSREYFSKNISYELDEEKRRGMERFLGWLRV